LITFLSISFISFLFLFSLKWLLVCVVNALIKGEIEHQSVRGLVDGLSWMWWVIDNVVWIDSWPSIAGACCGLICVGAGEEWARKVYALRGLRGVERQVGLTRGTRWPSGSSAGHMVARKARRSRRSEPVQGSGSWPESARGFAAVHQKTVGLLGWATKPRPEARRTEMGSGRAEKLRC
jgi:hypothetical protein